MNGTVYAAVRTSPCIKLPEAAYESVCKRRERQWWPIAAIAFIGSVLVCNTSVYLSYYCALGEIFQRLYMRAGYVALRCRDKAFS